MAYDVEQLINLRNQIGSQPVMPDASDRYDAMMGLAQQGGLPSVMLAEGGVPEGAGMDFPPTTRGQVDGVSDYQLATRNLEGPVVPTSQYIERVEDYRPRGHPKYEKPKSYGEEWLDKPRKDLDLDVKLMNWLRNLFTRETPPTKEELIQAERIKKILDSIKSEEKGGLISMLNVGGQPSIDAQVQNLASKGRFGDTMLMHVNPKEVAGLGGLTINPDTGLPEAFWMALPFLAKAMIIGAGVGAGRRAIGGKKAGSWLQNILGGAALGAAGAGVAGKAGIGAAAAGAPTVASGTSAAGAAALSGAAPQVALTGQGLGFLATPAATGAASSVIPGLAPSLSGLSYPASGLATMGGAEAVTGGLPSWAQKAFDSKLWKGIEEHPFRTASTLGGAAAMIPPEYEYPTTTEQGTSPTVPFPEVDVAERKLREDPITEEEAVARASGEIPPFNFYTKEGGPLSVAELQYGGQPNPFGTPRGGVFEGRVQGEGDGMADQVAFNVVPQTPADAPKTPDMALLSSDEYVVPADVVSMLGNGSSNAGAKALDKFNTLMRHKAHGTNKQQREINAGRELSSLA